MIMPSGIDDTLRLMNYLKANSPGRAELGPGLFLVTGLPLRGLSCSITGCDDATVIKAIPGQSEPVLDLRGYSYPPAACSHRVIERFAVEGDGLPPATPTEDKRGIVLGDGSGPDFGLCGIALRDISIAKTGGCCLDVGGSQNSHFERITLNNPVLASTNDVPYLRGMGGCNGNLFSRIGFRSMVKTEDCAPSGAAQFIEDKGPYTPCGNTFDSWWYEYQHLPPGATLLTLQGNHNVIRDFQYFDIGVAKVGSGTSLVRVLTPSPGKENYGGNRISGYLCGGANGYPDCGVEMHQRSNAVSGTKGKGGANVRLMPQARFTTITFDACEQEPSANSHGVVDHEGRPTVLDGTTTIFDRPNGYYYLGGGAAGATVERGNGGQWNQDGLYPGGFVKWAGSGGLGPGPDESLRYVGWSLDAKGNRRQGFVVPPLKGK